MGIQKFQRCEIYNCHGHFIVVVVVWFKGLLILFIFVHVAYIMSPWTFWTLGIFQDCYKVVRLSRVCGISLSKVWEVLSSVGRFVIQING